MPLVTVTLKPGFELRYEKAVRGLPGTESAAFTRQVLQVRFPRAIPSMLVENAGCLGLEPNTPLDAVQVTLRDFGPYDVNTPNVWVTVQFSEDCPSMEDRHRIRDNVYKILNSWFTNNGYLPGDLVVDLFWGPTNGKGTVNGAEIVW